MNEEKCLFLINLFKNCIFYRVFRFVIAKVCIFCCCKIGEAVDFDDLVVFLLSHCQVTKLHFLRLYIFFGLDC